MSAAGLVLLVGLAQPEVPAPEPPVSVERIQRELVRHTGQEPIKIPTVFRVTIEGRPMRLAVPWDPANDTVVPSYVRPQMSIYHYEFLMQVTPEAFRAGTLFTIGIPVVPIAEEIVEAIRNAARRREEERARREVDEALKRLLEARRKKEEEKLRSPVL
jgi:hypothetical protein